MKPDSTSVFKRSHLINPTTTKMCTRGGSTKDYATNFITHHHTLLFSITAHVPLWLGVSHPLERHPFSGPVHSAGELLHTPQQFSTSMTTILLLRWANSLL